MATDESAGEIINKKEDDTPNEQISKDILQIMNVYIYIAKINGMRNKKIYINSYIYIYFFEPSRVLLYLFK